MAERIVEDINDTSGTAADTLGKALARSEEEGWRGVIVLAMSGDHGARFLKSAALNDMEVVGLVRWAAMLAEDQALQDLTEPEEAL